jgi:hypothetical protein
MRKRRRKKRSNFLPQNKTERKEELRSSMKEHNVPFVSVFLAEFDEHGK